MNPRPPSRRALIAGAAALIAVPAWAGARRALPQMTDGPFYPPRAWRARWPDWDADLTAVTRSGRTLHARGEHLGLQLVVADTDERRIDRVEVEIWQCDAMAQYRHPDVAARDGTYDPGFQGFGAATGDAQGEVALRTIRPVPYPGRTPHIHVKLRHASFGEWTSQLFVAGDPGNERDFLWRHVRAADRPALEMQLQRAPVATAGSAGQGLAWVARHVLTLPA